MRTSSLIFDDRIAIFIQSLNWVTEFFQRGNEFLKSSFIILLSGADKFDPHK